MKSIWSFQTSDTLPERDVLVVVYFGSPLCVSTQAFVARFNAVRMDDVLKVAAPPRTWALHSADPRLRTCRQGRIETLESREIHSNVDPKRDQEYWHFETGAEIRVFQSRRHCEKS